MSYYKFEQNDIFTNRIKAHPRSYFLINNNRTFYNNDILPTTPGDTETIIETPQGHINLYEMNVNRKDGVGNSNLIYPYITKQGTLNNFSSVSTETFQGFSYGDVISGSYPLAASISTDYYATTDRDRIQALKNTFNYYRPLSNHYAFETTEWNKATQDIKLVSIPSIFFGSSIKKGSVKLNFYISGSLVATIEDKARNGELIQTLGAPAPATPATGSIEFLFDSTSPYASQTITITDSNDTAQIFFISTILSEGSTGDVDGLGRIIVQFNNLSSPESFASELATAIAGASGLEVSAANTSPSSVVNLTQNIAGDSGNKEITSTISSQYLALNDFTGGQSISPTNPNNGKVAGVVLYNEGFVALTGSWDLSSHQETYIVNGEDETPKWKYWGEYHRDPLDPNDVPDHAISSSWDIDFLGTNYIPTMTMLAHAKQGDLNYSNNPTFIDFEDKNDGEEETTLSLNKFTEDKELHIANIVQSPYPNTSGSFEKTTYISKIGIYDENKNLIGIAKLATPVKKTESRQYTFKMKVDF